MYSIKELYKLGNGPSSSHTIGPLNATKVFLERYSSVDYVKVILYGSLALTGKGHLTDYIINKTIYPVKCDIVFDIDTEQEHPNTLEFIGYKNNEFIGRMLVYSVGGGAIKIAGEPERVLDKIYPISHFSEISKYCSDNSITLDQFVDRIESKDFNDYLEVVYETMLESVSNGLSKEGTIPGNLQVKRKAKYIYNQATTESDLAEVARIKTVAYAYATAEENASGGLIVTAPTCGASGVVPACLKYALDLKKYNHDQIIKALKIAGLIGNIVKENGSISGAEAGCQAEIGTACAMAAAFLASLDSDDISRIERASEIALEHHLGLTCDPIEGYVQIPCIERNAVAALRAIDSAKMAKYLSSTDSKISFDLVVETMLATGKDLHVNYRETSEGGLAKKYR